MSESQGISDNPAAGPLDAGDFSAWLREIRQALRSDTDVPVACGDCIGCCSSSYFIPIRRDETETLSQIRWEIVVAAPRSPEGHLLLGYDDTGRCLMLQNGRCSIYAHRPRTCRTYDCRVLTATGLEAGGRDKETINQRVRRWRFNYPTETDRREHEAVLAAARFIRKHEDSFLAGAPMRPNQTAVLAIKAYEVFLRPGDDIGIDAVSDADLVKAIVEAGQRFDSTAAG